MKRFAVLFALAVVALATPVFAQTCTMGNDVDPGMVNAVTNSVQQYFSLMQNGNSAGLQAVAGPEFPDIAQVANNARPGLVGSTARVRTGPGGPWIFGLDATGMKPGDVADFYCGVFNSPDHVVFSFGTNLPPGKYAVAVQDASGGKVPYMITYVLQQLGGQWKIAGMVPKASQIAGKSGVDYWGAARTYLAAGKKHDAYMYYYIADALARPFPLIATPHLDKMMEEMQKADPGDYPVNGPINLVAADGKTYKVTSISPDAVNDQLYLVVKYSVPNVNDTAQAFQENTAVIKALVMRWPELREGFQGVVARATPPQGQDYGTLLAMKDIK